MVPSFCRSSDGGRLRCRSPRFFVFAPLRGIYPTDRSVRPSFGIAVPLGGGGASGLSCAGFAALSLIPFGRRPRLRSAAPLSFAGRLFRHFQTSLSYLAASVPFRRRIDCSAENSWLWDPHFTLFSPVFGSLMQRPLPSLCRSPFVILPLPLVRLPFLCLPSFPLPRARTVRRTAATAGDALRSVMFRSSPGCGLTGRCRIPPGEGCRRRCARCPAASGAPVPAVPVLRAASPRPRPASARRAGRARWRPRPRR